MDETYHIRFCTAADAGEVARMITTTFLGHDEYGEWAHMLLDGAHPAAEPRHTVVAIENNCGAIVSAIPCAPQVFSYGGIPFPVLNMQIVATLPEHREKGLLREATRPFSPHSSRRVDARVQLPPVFLLPCNRLCARGLRLLSSTTLLAVASLRARSRAGVPLELFQNSPRRLQVPPRVGELSAVVPLAGLSAADLARAGGKGANLGELTRAGFPVPAGFVITTAAYERANPAAGVIDHDDCAFQVRH